MSTTLHFKKMRHALQELKAIPLWGNVPSFPWHNFSVALAQGLDKAGLTLSAHITEWKEKEKLLSNFGADPIIVPFVLTPIEGTFFWVMSQQARNILLQQFLNPEGKNPGLIDPHLQEGFYRFVTLNALDLFNQLTPLGQLSAALAEETPLPEEGAFTTQITLELNGKKLFGQILCPKEAHAHFLEFFANAPTPDLNSEQFQDLPLTLHLEVGSTNLKATEWSQAEVGDFVLLERCTFDTNNQKGTALLKLHNTPLFHVRIKEGNIKLLEYALINEEPTMTDEDETYDDEQQEEGESKMISTKDIPLNIHVEIARFQMPLAKVLELKPGNVLDLGLGQSPHVHLIVGGERIAKGELVQLGEALGVKILSLNN